MSSLFSYIPLLAQGTGITIAAWLVAGSISIALGTMLGIISSSAVSSKTVISLVRIYTFITKGIPAYVQILICYFVLPSLLGINISGFIAASAALAICSSGYVTEIVRAGINAIPTGQWQACFILGYTMPETIRHIIAPQALRIVLPALIGELEQLLKSTSLLATIGVIDVTRAGMNIISRELNPLPVYLTIAGIYLVFSALLQICMLYTERKMHYGDR
ncbi:amino acid ABC transporter permease [Candidatus Dependentiae bacterium]|nr:amino acid ABC transporter permease [Candidatus Dependentiae bacterium]